MAEAAPPRVVVTQGLYGSASTWVFNVARELYLAAFGADSVLALYSDSLTKVLGHPDLRGRRVVWKMHRGEPDFTGFVELAYPAVLLSVRDPRDAVLSLIERFKVAPQTALAAIDACCSRLLPLAERGFPVLRYEDGYFAKPETVAAIAAHLRLPADAAAQGRIFTAYESDAVRAAAASVASLPPERLEGDAAVDLYDSVTQIHRNHIGDQRVGKWRSRIAAEDQPRLTDHFAPFLRRFGYL